MTAIKQALLEDILRGRRSIRPKNSWLAPLSPMGPQAHPVKRRWGVGRRCRMEVRLHFSGEGTLASSKAGATLLFFKFRAYALNVLLSGFRFLDGDNPANPLIASERRNIPHCARAAGS
jgi:hypothetical protein